MGMVQFINSQTEIAAVSLWMDTPTKENETFAIYFQAFEENIHDVYPGTVIVIENQAGKRYRGGNFLVGKAKEHSARCNVIYERELNLGRA